MKPFGKLFITGIAVWVLPLAAHAAPVSWGAWTAASDNTAILVPAGSTTFGGVNFNGSTTTINNGSFDVAFTGIALNASGMAAGITVASSGFAFQSTGGGNSNVVSAVGTPQTWGTVLDRVIGDDNNAATIDLSGLSPGTAYTVQFFSSTPDGGINATTKITSGGVESPAFGAHTGGETRSIIASFTADGTGQSFAVTGAEPTFGALVIGVQPGGDDTTAPEWIAPWPQVDPLPSTSLTVRAKTNETGTAHYVVLADGATAPSAAQVQAGNDSGNAPATASGSLALNANTEATAPVTGLTAETSYDVYFVAQDAVPNLQAAPILVNVSLVSPAVVTWGTWTDVTDNTAIQTPGGYTTFGGVNFNGSDTTINNGIRDVAFTGIALNASGTTAGIAVGSSGFAFQSAGGGNSNVNSGIGAPQTWGTALDRVIGDIDNSATIDLTGLTSGTSYSVQFFSSTPDGGINATTRITSGGVESPAFGSQTGGETRSITGTFTATSASQKFSIAGTEPTFGALVISVQPPGGGNTFAAWIGTFTGLNGLTGFGDDADGDGLDNGVENFLGTPPNVGNAGLTAGALTGNTFAFTHLQNATPASDVSAPVYSWSTDLVTFHASGASSGGITVTLLPSTNTPSTNTPSAGTTTVTATVAGTVPPRLFVRLGVTQQ